MAARNHDPGPAFIVPLLDRSGRSGAGRARPGAGATDALTEVEGPIAVAVEMARTLR